MLFIFLRIQVSFRCSLRFSPPHPLKVMVIQTCENRDMVLILNHSLQGLQGALEYVPWVCLGFGDLGCCTEAYGWKKSATNWRSRKTKDPETWLTIHQVKIQVLWAPRCGPQREARSASLRRLQCTILSCKVDHGHETVYVTVYVLIRVLSRKERLSPAQISDIFLVLKVASLYIFSQVSQKAPLLK